MFVTACWQFAVAGFFDYKTDVFIFFLVFFWTIPVTFVSGLSHLDKLKEIPGFEFVIYLLEASPVIIGFVEVCSNQILACFQSTTK